MFDTLIYHKITKSNISLVWINIAFCYFMIIFALRAQKAPSVLVMKNRFLLSYLFLEVIFPGDYLSYIFTANSQILISKLSNWNVRTGVKQVRLDWGSFDIYTVEAFCHLTRILHYSMMASH